eukprot:4928380-Amphidinium_carterae.2
MEVHESSLRTERKPKDVGSAQGSSACRLRMVAQWKEALSATILSTPFEVVRYGMQEQASQDQAPVLDDGQVPRSHDDLRGKKVATFIVYIDDLFAVGPELDKNQY